MESYTFLNRSIDNMRRSKPVKNMIINLLVKYGSIQLI